MKLAYVPVGATGHILSSLPMIGELVKKGVEITYFAPINYKENVEKTGAKYVEVPSVAGSGPIPEGDFLAAIPIVFVGEAMGVTEFVVKELEANPVDAIITDSLALAGKYASYKLGLPLINMFTSFASGEPFSISRFWPKYPDDNPARAQGIAMAKEMQAKYGGPLQTVDQIFDSWADYNIVTVSRSYHPESDKFDAGKYFFAGAQIAERAGDGTWKAPDNGKPLLYTSLGSLFNNWPEFYTMLFEAVKDLDINVLCSLGNHLKPEDLGEIPANVTTMAFTPQLEVLAHCDYFITHAGIGSVMEALYFGVPMFCLPQMDEQEFTAGCAMKCGVTSGILTKPETTTEKLREGLLKLINDPSYKKAAQAMADEMHNEGGCERAAQAVIDYVNSL